ncbi:MAG: hypothetical protein M0T77_02650 [Actinomycetota bacterium]|nr:hypothetical protein [Actinomycetota bacterium]
MSERSSLELKARIVLGELRKAAPDAIVIGGWATWLRTRGDMSHDIDVIATFEQLSEIGRHAHVEQSSARQAGAVKWRGEWDGVHLDLYVPHKSRLGTALELRVEQLARYAETIDGYRVLTIPAQIAAKWAALVDRKHSSRGLKDRAELLELLRDPRAGDAAGVLRETSAKPPNVVDDAIRDGFQYLQAGAPKTDRERLRRLQAAWVPAPPSTDGSPSR